MSRMTVYDWLACGVSLAPKRYDRQKARKLDWSALLADVEAHPDSLLRERAARFGVQNSAIWYALKQMNITHKKNSCATAKDGQRNE